ncbi:MAG: tRNA pseudouridine synthase A [Mycoplasmataceae bacterium]|nr:MAG: tRNA pseudouridine synthase A [Mycoplasmataceae bacterium]
MNDSVDNSSYNLYLVSISYDGSSFFGWASQPNFFTVQGFIEKRLSSIFDSNIRILSSSRTDKGVHALDQKFTFKTNLIFSNFKLKSILRKTLKDFVYVKSVKKVKKEFHPINDVIFKEYRYFINIGENNIFLKNYSWNYNSFIDVKKLRRILNVFQGYHNFFNFSFCRERNKEIKNSCREIDKISIVKDDNLIIIKIIAKGFLRYQIRAIIGESLLYYNNDMCISNLKERLTGEFNDKYKSIAPSSGLYLWKIKFKNIS